MPEQLTNQFAWYAMLVAEVAKQLQVDPAKGLSAGEAAQRLQQYGPNVLAGKKKEPGWLRPTPERALADVRRTGQLRSVGAASFDQCDARRENLGRIQAERMNIDPIERGR
jgi:hypothetical protein